MKKKDRLKICTIIRYIDELLDEIYEEECDSNEGSFTEERFNEIIKQADFIYMDPPYLITNAVYNSCWNSKLEHALLDFIDELISKNINFALSNVIEKVGKTNEPLSYWCHKNNEKIEVHHIEYHYRSASYNKTSRNAKEQEVLIVNKRYQNENK